MGRWWWWKAVGRGRRGNTVTCFTQLTPSLYAPLCYSCLSCTAPQSDAKKLGHIVIVRSAHGILQSRMMQSLVKKYTNQPLNWWLWCAGSLESNAQQQQSLVALEGDSRQSPGIVHTSLCRRAGSLLEKIPTVSLQIQIHLVCANTNTL